MYILEALLSYKNCKDDLQILMREGGLDETDFDNVLHELLEKIKGDELKIFILTRKQDVRKSKITKIGKT